MQANLADLVHPIFSHGISLSDRLDAGDAIDWTRERSVLADRLAAFDAGSSPVLDIDDRAVFDFFSDADQNVLNELTKSTIRFSLTCWIDEVVCSHPGAEPGWREKSLEQELFDTSDGSAKFWEQGHYAEARGDLDALEVMHLCVALGFRGAWRDQTARLERWEGCVRALLEQTTEGWVMPASLEMQRPGSVRPSDRRLAFSLLLSFALALPMVAVLLWRSW